MDDKLKQVLVTFSKVLKDFSVTLKSYADYEEAVYKAFGEDVDPLAIDKVFFEKFLEVAKENPTFFGEFMIAMFELAKLSEEYKDINNIPPEQKRVIADKLAELAGSLKKLVGEGS
ncbi:hypothetical protein ACO3VM_02040 [Methanocaldococcus sp. 10A]